MAHLPVGVQFGQKWTILGPDGTVATFNDPTDPNYVGVITDATGFDSPEVRENADDLVQQDGGIHGDFFYGRRPITLSGTIYDAPNAAARNTRLDTLIRATNALRGGPGMRGAGLNYAAGDSLVSWIPDGGEQVFLACRRQQPLRVTGGFAKDFQISMVAQDPRIYAYTPTTVVLGRPSPNSPFNFVTTPSFESGVGTGAWSTSTVAGIVNSGAVLGTAGTGPFGTNTGSTCMSISVGGGANEGCQIPLGVLGAGTFNFSAYLLAASGSTSADLLLGTNTSPAAANTSTLSTTTATRFSVNFTNPTTQALFATIRVNQASKVIYVDGCSVVQASTPPVPYFDGDTPGYGWLNWENFGRTYSGAITQTVIENKGNTFSYPQIAITTPADVMLLTNGTTGQQTFFDTLGSLGSLAAHQVIVDMLNRTVFFDATNIYGALDGSRLNPFWGLAPGLNSCYWTSSLNDGVNSSLTMTYRDAWI